MAAPILNRALRRALHWPGAPVLVFVALSLAYAASLRGLQYDEALNVLGAVQMLRSREELPLPRDPDTWLCGLGRCWPLMTMRYVGALREYLSLPVLAAFGTQALAVRLSGIVCAAFGVWGVARLSMPAAWMIAVSAGFVNQCVFDQGALTASVACFGLICLGAATKNPLLAGLGAGLGIWARANFAWLVIGGVIGFWRHWRMAPRAILGGAVGVAPFVAYQLLSGFLTFRSMGEFRAQGSWADLASARITAFANTLVSTAEQRSLWDGPPLPVWQPVVFGAALLACIGFCLVRGDAWARGLAVTSVVTLAFLFTSRLPVAEHHFAPILPLFALVVAAAAARVPRRVAWAGAALFLGVSAYWHVAGLQGLRRTDGVAGWSGAIADVRTALDPHREVRILDWGFQNSLFVLSNGRQRSREDLDDASLEHWRGEVARGGLFLAHPVHQAFIPGPYAAFRQALFESGREPARAVFREKRGRVWAELWDVPAGPAAPPALGPFGLHEADAEGWRWTKGEFGALFPAREGEATVTMRVHVPQAVLDRTGPLVLTAMAGTTRLDDGHYWTSGVFEYSRRARAAGPLYVRFSLDKFLAAGEVEGRELGVMVKDLAAR